MSDLLREPEICLHNSDTIVFNGTEGPLCGDCHAQMIWVAESSLAKMQQSQVANVATIRALRAQNERLKGVLSALQHSIAIIARMEGPS